jgi:hypothetical protein
MDAAGWYLLYDEYGTLHIQESIHVIGKRLPVLMYSSEGDSHEEV